MSEILDIAEAAVRHARQLGADDAECTVAEGEEFSAGVRLREVENLKQAGARGAGIRVLIGRNTGSSHTSDLTPAGIEDMVRSAVDLAKVTTEDPHAGLPDPDELGVFTGDLALYSDDVAALDTAWKIQQALRAEEVALAADPRIQNSDGASFDSYLGARAFANSRGFAGQYRMSSCSLSVVPIAKQNGSMEKDYWHTSARAASRLESADLVGRRAAERAVRRLNPRKIETQKATIVFEPRTAKSIIGEIAGAANGGAIYRHASFLDGMLGEKIASDLVTVIDDSTIPGLFGSAPFDDEGVPSRRNVIVERGVLKSYLLNVYCARKLGLKTTGSASRGLSGNAGVGSGNFFLEPGTQTEAQILAGIPRGLYVTQLMGSNANSVTGDYSSGVSGIWIENGELAYPVAEITIAGNLKQMLLGITHVASELEFRSSLASPTIVIQEMTISGR